MLEPIEDIDKEGPIPGSRPASTKNWTSRVVSADEVEELSESRGYIHGHIHGFNPLICSCLNSIPLILLYRPCCPIGFIPGGLYPSCSWGRRSGGN